MIATQGPIAGAAIGAPISTPAWSNKPSWFVIASKDRMISPKLEEAEAQKMKATSITVSASHVAMLSHPNEVAELIEQAAGKAGNK